MMLFFKNFFKKTITHCSPMLKKITSSWANLSPLFHYIFKNQQTILQLFQSSVSFVMKRMNQNYSVVFILFVVINAVWRPYNINIHRNVRYAESQSAGLDHVAEERKNVSVANCIHLPFIHTQAVKSLIAKTASPIQAVPLKYHFSLHNHTFGSICARNILIHF